MRIGMMALLLMCGTAETASAQWLSLPLPGTPRTADGKANLSAPAPRAADGKPDLSGIWVNENRVVNENLARAGTQAPMLPWAEEIYKHRTATMGYDRPMTRCMPHGVPDAVTSPYPFKIIQTRGVAVILYEEFHKYRQIHTDGRALPVDPDPAYYGYSVGRWDGDTLIVETAGFKEGSWLDNGGHPHTDALRITERFRRSTFGRMTLDVTVDDPKAYTRPWNAETFRFNLQPDTELLEHLCENNRDQEHLQDFWNQKK
jgi:hypothetical protein